MPAATKKRPPMELEPGEGKAHEAGESTEEEIREGAEPDDAPKFRSRKRSAKGAKRTKAPMDAECGCDGKGRKGKTACDGNCGSSMKPERSDALTPQEYLAACELGIQGRSRAYIRARLDAAERLDLKCGNGSISEGEKCHVGPAQKTSPSEGRSTKNSRRRIAGNLLTAVGTVGNLATAYGAMKGLATGNSTTLSKALQRQAAFSALAGAGQHLTASGTTNKKERAQLRAAANSSLGMAAFGGVAGHALGGGYTRGLSPQIKKPNLAKAASNIKGRVSALRGNFTQKRTRISLERMYQQPGRRDSIYAAGFSPDQAALAL